MEAHPGRALRAAATWAQAVGDRERAERWYRKAVEGDEPGALNDYGSFRSEEDARLEEAEEHFKEEHRRRPAECRVRVHGDPQAGGPRREGGRTGGGCRASLGPLPAGFGS